MRGISIEQVFGNFWYHKWNSNIFHIQDQIWYVTHVMHSIQSINSRLMSMQDLIGWLLKTLLVFRPFFIKHIFYVDTSQKQYFCQFFKLKNYHKNITKNNCSVFSIIFSNVKQLFLGGFIGHRTIHQLDYNM